MESPSDKNAADASVSAAKIDRYLIDGSLPIGLWRFAAPYMLAFLLQALYGAVDLFMVGRFCNEAAIAATATGTQLLHALIGVILGFSAGGTALIARRIGAKNDEGAARAVGSTSTVFAIAAIILTPICALGADRFVELMQTPEESIEYARQYVFIVACGAPFIIGCNVFGAIYRGFGDATTPTVFVAFACAFNVLGDYLFVARLGRGPEGAAIATVLAQALSFLAALAYMRLRRFPLEIHRRHFLPDKESVDEIVSSGAPLALQDALTSVSFLVILAIVNGMGVVAAAGMGVAERIVGFFFLPPVAFSIAVVTASAQNLGARRPRRAFQAMTWGIVFSFAFGALFWTLSQICPVAMSTIFTEQANVALNSSLYLRSFTIDCALVAFVFNLNGWFTGVGRTTIVLVHSALAALLARIPLSYVLSRGEDATLYDVGFAAPISTALSIAICVVYFIWLKRTGRLRFDATSRDA